MDPFTQRMLERARARREKLDTQLSNAGHDVKRRRSPLKDTNAILAQATVTKGKSPTQSPEKVSISNAKSKLQKLGKLYSDDSSVELSSPIHRTEERFHEEEENIVQKPTRKGARLDRLAALASTINNWEDDLSHPTLVKPADSNKVDRIHAKFNEQVKNIPEPQPSTSGYKAGGRNSKGLSPKKNEPCSTKQLKWDKIILQSLGKDVGSPSSSKLAQVKEDATHHKDRNEKNTKERFGFNSAPKSPAQSSPGSVLSKASLFESKNTEGKAKDPAQMSLSERMALFEKNKGEAPLLPKASLCMSVPLKKLREKEKINPASQHPTTAAKTKTDIPNNAVNVQKEKFEQSLSTQSQCELDMLRTRFNRNKEMAQAAAGSCIRTNESSEGKSNSPKNSPVCPVKSTPASDCSIPPPLPPLPKPGHLYPNLSDIENTTETDTKYTVNSTEAETAETLDEKTDTETARATEAEYYVQDDESEIDNQEECEEPNTSLDRSILRVVKEQAFLNKKRSIDPDPDSSTSDISVLNEMDEYLDECLAQQEAHVVNCITEEGPTPPKLNRGDESPSNVSTSFKYSQGSPYRSPIKTISSASPKQGESYVTDGDNCVPLMHSVSFYRRQQSQTPKTPVRIISRIQESPGISSNTTTVDDAKCEAVMVQEKVKKLLDDVSKQQTIISQASQALNLCTSTVEFNNSREHTHTHTHTHHTHTPPHKKKVEGERLLLVATHRRQAALNEIQRLKVEGTLKPVSPGSPEVQESGSLTISAITLPIKREYFRSNGTNTCLHFVCLIRHLEEIVATPVAVAESGDSCIRFPSTLKLHNLYNDFKINVEIYSLQTKAEILPHEIKYHINNGSGCSSSNNNCNKKLANKTPKKFLKQEGRLVMPSGPSAVQSPAFKLSGDVIVSLKELHRQQFTLNKVPSQSPLEGQLQIHFSSELSISVEHRGFLTMFEDISGFGAWHRRWCVLKGSTLTYWKYPDDEKKKTPIGTLDLQNVFTKQVGLVSRDICARANTFLLETSKHTTTTIRHLLSVDTKEERLEWCVCVCVRS